MDDLTAFQRDLLYMIASLEEPYGLEIKNHLENYYLGDVKNARLYQNADRLVEQGLVQKGSIDDRTNCYELTDAGESVLERRRQWENHALPEDVLSA
jgi:DNA-binding PadR family transcriptional regulator